MAQETTTEETATEETATGKGSLFTLEGILMLSIAVVLDLIGLVLFILSFFGVGIPPSFILDIAGLATIGTWTLIRSGKVGATRRTVGMFRKSLGRLGLGFLGELIPFFGDIAFCWTLVVYLELKSK